MKQPIIKVNKKNKIPTKIVKNLITKPKPREIVLNDMYSNIFFKSRPRGFLVISLFHGENKVFKSKGIEKYSTENKIKFFHANKIFLTPLV